MHLVTSAQSGETPRARQSAPSTTLRIEAASTKPTVDTSPQRRALLEHELDRVQGALQSERTAHGQQLNWLVVSQTLLVNAYVVLLVVGWSAELPGKRWLLAGVAVLGAAVAVMIYLALRGSRDAMATLSQRRRELEGSLFQDFNRPPVFVPRSIVTRGAAAIAVRLLPPAFLLAWFAMTLYALGAPLPLG